MDENIVWIVIDLFITYYLPDLTFSVLCPWRQHLSQVWPTHSANIMSRIINKLVAVQKSWWTNEELQPHRVSPTAKHELSVTTFHEARHYSLPDVMNTKVLKATLWPDSECMYKCYEMCMRAYLTILLECWRAIHHFHTARTNTWMHILYN